MKIVLLSIFILTFVGLFTISANAQFIIEYENQGTFKSIRGQVQDGLEEPVANANILVFDLNSQQKYNSTTDYDGNFKFETLPNGNYKVRVESQGFNITQFSLILDKNKSKALMKYIIVGLSPGCSSGGDKVELVDKLKKKK